MNNPHPLVRAAPNWTKKDHMLIDTINGITPFDTETTGVDVENDRIVTAYIAVMDTQGNVLRQWDWLINPGIDIPEGASAVHGITTEQAVAEGMDPPTAIAEIVETLRREMSSSVPIGPYNGKFDMTILDREARRYGIEPLTGISMIDPFIIDKHLDPYRRGNRKLITTAEHYGITLENAHSADADALAAGLLGLKLLSKIPAEIETIDQLHAAQIVWAREQAISLETYLRRTDPEAVCERVWPVALLPDESLMEEMLDFV